VGLANHRQELSNSSAKGVRLAATLFTWTLINLP